MKVALIKVLMGLLSASSIASASASSGVEGAWSLSNRVCTQGEAAQDNFILGRDNMLIQFKDGAFAFANRINGMAYSGEGIVSVTPTQIRVASGQLKEQRPKQKNNE